MAAYNANGPCPNFSAAAIHTPGNKEESRKERPCRTVVVVVVWACLVCVSRSRLVSKNSFWVDATIVATNVLGVDTTGFHGPNLGRVAVGAASLGEMFVFGQPTSLECTLPIVHRSIRSPQAPPFCLLESIRPTIGRVVDTDPWCLRDGTRSKNKSSKESISLPNETE